MCLRDGGLMSRKHIEACLPSMIPLTLDEQYEVAVHELGHALCAAYLDIPVDYVEVHTKRLEEPKKEGSRLGFASLDFKPKSARDYENLMSVMLASIPAEQLILGSQQNGTISDVKKASDFALEMIIYGMNHDMLIASDRMQSDFILQNEIKRMNEKALKRATEIVSKFEGIIPELAEQLVIKKRLSGDFIRTVAKSLVCPANVEKLENAGQMVEIPASDIEIINV
jgi:ATP-dependent Zn protease